MNLHFVCKYRIYNVTKFKIFYILTPLFLHLSLIIEFFIEFLKFLHYDTFSIFIPHCWIFIAFQENIHLFKPV